MDIYCFLFYPQIPAKKQAAISSMELITTGKACIFPVASITITEKGYKPKKFAVAGPVSRPEVDKFTPGGYAFGSPAMYH